MTKDSQLVVIGDCTNDLLYLAVLQKLEFSLHPPVLTLTAQAGQRTAQGTLTGSCLAQLRYHPGTHDEPRFLKACIKFVFHFLYFGLVTQLRYYDKRRKALSI